MSIARAAVTDLLSGSQWAGSHALLYESFQIRTQPAPSASAKDLKSAVFADLVRIL